MDGGENRYKLTENGIFRPVAFKVHKYRTNSISTVIFRCERINKFVFYSLKGDTVDILRGLPQMKSDLKSEIESSDIV